MRLKLKILLFLLTLHTSYFILHTSVFAQEQPFNITTSPNAFDLTSSPGETLKQTIKLRNNSDINQTLKIEIKKLIPTADGQITIRDFKKEEDYQHWITVENASINTRAREWTFIPFSINIPKTAAFGYYYALVISPQQSKTPEAITQTRLTGAVAIPVLLAVEKDGEKFEGVFEEFKTDSGFYEYLPANFLTTFTNSGNIHVKPVGSIFVKDIFGNQVAVLDINKELGSTLPNAKRTFTASWSDSFIAFEKQEDGTKKLKIRFDKILDLRIGKYTANALLVVSGKDRDYSYEKSTTFWVFPWKIVIGAIVFVILAGIGLISTTKSTTKKIKGWFKK